MSVNVVDRPAVVPTSTFVVADVSANQLVPLSRTVNAVEVLRKVEPDAYALRYKSGVWSQLSGVLGALTSATATAFTILGTGPLVSPVVAGVAAALTLGSAGAGVLQHRRANRTLSRAHGDDIAGMEARAASASGLERAMIVATAMRLHTTLGGRERDTFDTVMGLFGVRSGAFHVTKRLAVLAAMKDSVLAEHLAEAESILALTNHVRSACSHLEHMIADLERLTPEGRACARALIEKGVLAELDASPGNAFRRQRFLEALDGKREPYLEHGVEATSADHSLEPGIIIGSKVPLRSVGAAALVAQRAFGTQNAVCVDLESVELAKQAAHYFETRRFRAAILENAADRVSVAVYQADDVPWNVFAQREKTQDTLDRRRHEWHGPR